jgi:hypothetical protein
MGQTESGGRRIDYATDPSNGEFSDYMRDDRDRPDRESGSGRQNGVDRNASGELADPEGLGRKTGRSMPLGIFEGFAGFENGCIDFPPGPGDLQAWQELLTQKPHLIPALTPQAAAELGIRPRTDGISRRMALRMLGNAVDPWQAYPLFKAIAEAAGSA